MAVELAFKNYNEQMVRQKKDVLPYIFIKNGTRFEKLDMNEIRYLEADGSYCKITTAEKEYVLTGNLNHFGEQLDHTFLSSLSKWLCVSELQHILDTS